MKIKISIRQPTVFAAEGNNILRTANPAAVIKAISKLLRDVILIFLFYR